MEPSERGRLGPCLGLRSLFSQQWPSDAALTTAVCELRETCPPHNARSGAACPHCFCTPVWEKTDRMVRVVVADDHAGVREQLKRMIAESDDLTLVGEAGTGEEVLRKVLECDCDVVLLDINMPGRNGLEVTQELRTLRPGLRILVLSVHTERQYATRALRSGASGYLSKESAPEELIAAIRCVASGEQYVCSSIAETLAPSLTRATKASPHRALSEGSVSGQIEALIQETGCQYDPASLVSALDVHCLGRSVGFEAYCQCGHEKPALCRYALPSGYRFFCKCPLSLYIRRARRH